MQNIFFTELHIQQITSICKMFLGLQCKGAQICCILFIGWPTANLIVIIIESQHWCSITLSTIYKNTSDHIAHLLEVWHFELRLLHNLWFDSLYCLKICKNMFRFSSIFELMENFKCSFYRPFSYNATLKLKKRYKSATTSCNALLHISAADLNYFGKHISFEKQFRKA